MASHQRHERPRQGDDQLLARFLGQALESSQPADGVRAAPRECECRSARGEDVTELVQQDAEEHEQHEDAVATQRSVRRAVQRDRVPRHQEQEGDVDPDLRSRGLSRSDTTTALARLGLFTGV
jgi:hypothetical protein